MSPELEQIRQRTERLTRDISEEGWRQAPPGKWCCGQVLEHLLLSYSATTRALLSAMNAGRPLGSKPTLRDRVRTLAVTKFRYIPTGNVASRSICAKDGIEYGSLRRFYDALVAMDSTLADSERRFGRKVKLLDHPLVGPLNAKEWRRFHLAHSFHHFRQIEQRSGRTQSPSQHSAKQAQVAAPGAFTKK